MPVDVPKILLERGNIEGLTFFPEHGSLGGVPGDREIFGTNINPDAIIDSTEVFEYYLGGGLDITFLGCGQIDSNGNVNVSKFNGIVPGCGGFIDITHNIKKEGRFFKFINDVEQVTFSANEAIRKGQEVVYVTERAVFRLESDGVHLIEIAPGVDVEKDIISLIPFEIKIDNPVLMDEKHFQ